MTFSEIRRVVTFCKAGWEAAKAHGVHQTAVLRTTAPVFHSFSNTQVEPFIFDNGNPDSPHQFGAELQETCQRIGKALRDVPALADRVPTVIAAVTHQQNLLRFANALSWEDLNEPTLLIMPVLPNGLPADPFCPGYAAVAEAIFRNLARFEEALQGRLRGGARTWWN